MAARVARRFPSASVMTGGPEGPSTRCAHDRPPCQTPSVMPATVRTPYGRGVLDRGWRNSRRQSRPRTGLWFGEGSGKGLAIRHSGDVLMGGASGAGGLLLNTKASQEAACSRAPAAIVPSQEPESRDAGVSRFRRIGSHLAETGATEGHAGQVSESGMSGNAGRGSHLEVASVTDAAGVHVSGPGSSRNAGNGSHPAAADFSNEPGAVLWRRSPSRRTESGLLSYGTASPDSSVQKTALWCTRGSS